MYIFYGKLNWSDYVLAEPLVLLFPGELRYYDPVCLYWQWTKDDSRRKKVNNWFETSITSIAKEKDGRLSLGFDVDSIYFFNVLVDRAGDTVELTMKDQRGTSSGLQTLRQSFKSSAKIPRCLVYVGKINEQYYADNEMLTVVVPTDFGVGSDVCVYFQWTKDANGVQNSNNYIVTTFETSNATPEGGIVVSFKSNDKYYVWEGVVSADRTSITMNMYEASRYPNSRLGSSKLDKVGWSAHENRKALIVRYGTGTDNGIFNVRDLLCQNLGWTSSCVEMLYYDSEPSGQPAICSQGQYAPTVSRFMERFEALIRDAKPGNVRFLYVDAHGTARDSFDSGEIDHHDEGWVLADNDNGRQKAIIWDKTLAEKIKTYLDPAVNLTILTTSCLGGGMLDTRKGALGVLLAGVHESQTNVKIASYFSGQDPWTFAVVRIVKKYLARNRSMPTYTQLYKEAKGFIFEQMRQGAFRSDKYLGPSPDESNPLPRNDDNRRSSHQDPQLVFVEGYTNVDTEQFLYPISEWKLKVGVAQRETKQYPKDEF